MENTDDLSPDELLKVEAIFDSMERAQQSTIPALARVVALVSIANGGIIPRPLDPPAEPWESYIAKALAKEFLDVLGISAKSEEEAFGGLIGLVLFNTKFTQFLTNLEPESRGPIADMRAQFEPLARQMLPLGMETTTEADANFFKGVSQGTKSSFNSEGLGFRLQNTILYFVLLLLREKVVTFQSRTELHSFWSTI